MRATEVPHRREAHKRYDNIICHNVSGPLSLRLCNILDFNGFLCNTMVYFNTDQYNFNYARDNVNVLNFRIEGTSSLREMRATSHGSPPSSGGPDTL
jgi:hypothetical protein